MIKTVCLQCVWLHVPSAEWMRVCTMLSSTPRCWRCRLWWLSSTMTSAMQEIPWRTPRMSARGQDGAWMRLVFSAQWSIFTPNSPEIVFTLLKTPKVLLTRLPHTVSHKFMSAFTWPGSDNHQFDCVCMREAAIDQEKKATCSYYGHI